VGDVPLPKGTLITLCIGSANRDPAQFENAEQMDVTRLNCKHLSFAFGIHQCAGLHLARLEGRVALQIFLQRFPNYKLTAAPTRGGRARFRGFLNAPFCIN
jgi:cytochrome P450